MIWLRYLCERGIDLSIEPYLLVSDLSAFGFWGLPSARLDDLLICMCTSITICLIAKAVLIGMQPLQSHRAPSSKGHSAWFNTHCHSLKIFNIFKLVFLSEFQWHNRPWWGWEAEETQCQFTYSFGSQTPQPWPLLLFPSIRESNWFYQALRVRGLGMGNRGFSSPNAGILPLPSALSGDLSIIQKTWVRVGCMYSGVSQDNFGGGTPPLCQGLPNALVLPVRQLEAMS